MNDRDPPPPDDDDESALAAIWASDHIASDRRVDSVYLRVFIVKPIMPQWWAKARIGEIMRRLATVRAVEGLTREQATTRYLALYGLCVEPGWEERRSSEGARLIREAIREVYGDG